MGYALAGLLSGVGQGIAQAGKTLEERRQQALEWASRLEMNRQDNETKAADEAARIASEREKERAQDRRTQAQIDSNEAIAAAGITSRANLQDQALTHAEKMEVIRAQNAQNLEVLKGNIESGHIKLRGDIQHTLETGEVAGSSYGPINHNTGASELILYKKDGSIIHTGQQVMVPETRDNEGRQVDAPGAYRPPARGNSNPFGAPAATSGARVIRYDAQGRRVG